MNNILPKYQLDYPIDQNDFSFMESEELFKFLAINHEPHSHDYFILSFLYSGSVLHLADFESDRVSAPAILLLDIDRVHTHPTVNGRIKSVSFSQKLISDRGSVFFSKLNELFSRSSIKISVDELGQIDSILCLMQKHNISNLSGLAIIRSLLDVLVVYCTMLSEHYPTMEIPTNNVYADFRKLLKSQFTEHHEVTFYADQLNITTTVLNQQVKQFTGKSPKQLIDEHLLIEAKRLLYWSKITSRELSWKLGFETDSYFNRFFKKYTGTTPKEYQKNSIAEQSY
ncbi:helix-turn-helix domain-containing protein [Pedobacter petrophilus]|uniref:Helix-turn-helix domain-containing protein n=1 Tax=Pedobacter petrophilus TaxID=1908241 RepID=A0A7K0G6C5_9SPHI|nr:helix-turn-helix domain-containing protein [Pedobacter petrophilus]MRX78546.1 helix-turn-helix domain-containing protein [Pedobacter petrophilus]